MLNKKDLVKVCYLPQQPTAGAFAFYVGTKPFSVVPCPNEDVTDTGSHHLARLQQELTRLEARNPDCFTLPQGGHLENKGSLWVRAISASDGLKYVHVNDFFSELRYAINQVNPQQDEWFAIPKLVARLRKDYSQSIYKGDPCYMRALLLDRIFNLVSPFMESLRAFTPFLVGYVREGTQDDLILLADKHTLSKGEHVSRGYEFLYGVYGSKRFFRPADTPGALDCHRWLISYYGRLHNEPCAWKWVTNRNMCVLVPAGTASGGIFQAVTNKVIEQSMIAQYGLLMVLTASRFVLRRERENGSAICLSSSGLAEYLEYANGVLTGGVNNE